MINLILLHVWIVMVDLKLLFWRVTISLVPILVLVLLGSALSQDSESELNLESDDEITVEDVTEVICLSFYTAIKYCYSFLLVHL